MEELNEIEANEVSDRLELAVVKRVKALEPILGKDRVELVLLEDCGYTVVCEKIHTVGDLVVFIKYDTVVPKTPLFAFMESFKYRVKPKSFTIKDGEEVVGKIYSQGIVLPLKEVLTSMILETVGDLGGMDYYLNPDNYVEGQDLTTELGVTKYIPPVMTGAGSGFGEMRSKGDFPTHIVSKTDELNLASKTRLLEELQGQDIYITLKIEGSSATNFLDDATGELIVCSRNNMISDAETNKFWIAARKYDLANQLLKYPHLVLQSELYGEGIQKNKLGISGVDQMTFNIKTKVDKTPLGLYDMEEVAAEMNLKLVPLVCVIHNFRGTFDDLQKIADAQVYDNGVPAEGIVVRPVVPFFSRYMREWFSVKVISREYKF